MSCFSLLLRASFHEHTHNYEILARVNIFIDDCMNGFDCYMQPLHDSTAVLDLLYYILLVLYV